VIVYPRSNLNKSDRLTRLCIRTTLNIIVYRLHTHSDDTKCTVKGYDGQHTTCCRSHPEARFHSVVGEILLLLGPCYMGSRWVDADGTCYLECMFVFHSKWMALCDWVERARQLHSEDSPRRPFTQYLVQTYSHVFPCISLSDDCSKMSLCVLNYSHIQRQI
jgi:hypothetical protein